MILPWIVKSPNPRTSKENPYLSDDSADLSSMIDDDDDDDGDEEEEDDGDEVDESSSF